MQKLVWINANNEELDLTSGSYGVTNWEGFSNTELNIQSQQVPFQDGSVFLDALLADRQLSVTLAMDDNGDLKKRYQLRRELIHSLNPKLGEGYLIYTNDFLSKRIKCVAKLPLFPTKNSNTRGTPKASLSWTACSPYWEDLEETSVEFALFEEKEIINKGDISTPIKVKYFGGKLKNISIKNKTSDKQITIADTLENKDVIINTSMGNKTVEEEKITINDIASAGTISSMVYSERLKKYIGVGTNGNIISSSDGFSWKLENSGINVALKSVIEVESLNLLIAVGGDSYTTGKIIISEDGSTWVEKYSSVGKNLKNITFQNNKIIILSGNNLIITSDDGEIFSELSGNDIPNLDNIYWVEDEAAYYGGTNSLNFKSSDLTTWTILEIIGTFKRITFYSKTNNKFYGYIDSETRELYESTDAINWTQVELTLPENFWFSSNQFSFFEVPNNTIYPFFWINYRRICFSSDMKTWYEGYYIDPDVTTSYEYLKLIVYSNVEKQFIITSNSNLYNSYNLKNWYIILQGIVTNLKFIIFSEVQNKLITSGVISAGLKTISASEDGFIWDALSKETYGADLFNDGIYVDDLKTSVIVGYETRYNRGRIVRINPEGLISAKATNRTSEFQCIIYSKSHDLLIAISRSGVYYKLSTSEEIDWGNWIEVSLPAYNIKSIVENEKSGLFVIVGNSGVVYTSTDLENWTLQTSGTTENLNSITYSEILDLFVAVGDNGTVITSQDAINWTLQTSGTTENLNKVFFKNKFFILGNNGIILNTVNGVSFIVIQLNSKVNLYGGCYSEKLKKYVFVGDGGFIINSSEPIVENIINKLSSDSNMNLELLVDKNILRITGDNGSVATIELTYRQKYLGV